MDVGETAGLSRRGNKTNNSPQAAPLASRLASKSLLEPPAGSTIDSKQLTLFDLPDSDAPRERSRSTLQADSRSMRKAQKTLDVLAEHVRTPCRRLIRELTRATGKRCSYTIESVCHGLEELPSLKYIYPFLNLDEALAFAATTWRARQKEGFRHFVSNAPLYSIFDYVLKKMPGRVRLRKPVYSKEAHADMNPYRGTKETLRKRLSVVSEEDFERLRSELQREPCEYDYVGRRPSYPTIPMHYQVDYPTDRNTVNKKYAYEISRIFENYYPLVQV